MREMLFKAKTYNGEWVEGMLARKGSQYYISNKAGAPFVYEVAFETICQYTGLTDKICHIKQFIPNTKSMD